MIHMEFDGWNIRQKASILVNGPFPLNDVRLSSLEVLSSVVHSTTVLLLCLYDFTSFDDRWNA